MVDATQDFGAWRTYKRLLTYIRPYWWIALIAIVTNALFGAIDAELIKSLKPLFDKGFGEKDLSILEHAPYWVVLFVVVRSILGYVSEYTMSWVGRTIVQDMRQQLFEHYLRVPAPYYDAHTAGQLTSAIIFNTERVAQATTETIKESMREGFFISWSLVSMFLINWRLSLLFFIVGPVIALILRSASKRFRTISRSVQNSMGAVTHVSNEAIQGYRVVRTFGGEAFESARFLKAAESNRRQQMKMVATKAASVGLIQLFAGLGVAIVLAFAAHQIANGRVTPGEFVAVTGLMLAILKPLKSLSNLNAQTQQGLAAAQSIFDVIDEPAEKDLGTHTVAHARGELRFEDVVFTYASATEPALRMASFTVGQGKTIALVGRSGSGKSTIASLLLRLYEQEQGRILLDDIDIRDYKLANYRAQIAIVSQHVTLFNDTIANNIAYGSLNEASREQIEHAAKLAQAWDFIQESPLGLETSIGDNGLMLSGGQRQRLAIARAILKNAPVLILDEATSALDNQSERLIQTALDQLMKDRTTIVIAHRLSTIEKADQILVIDGGKIIEQGRHSELLALNGEYSRLHAAQFSDNV